MSGFRPSRETDLVDELDPCCLREMQDRKKAASVSAELRKTDRSNVRYDAIKAAFQDLKQGAWHRCSCCEVPTDYPLLENLRGLSIALALDCAPNDDDDRVSQEWNSTGSGYDEPAHRLTQSSSCPFGDGDGDGSDVDDDDDGDLDAFMADIADDPLLEEIEMKKRETMIMAVQRREMALMLGFGVHMEDSVMHIKMYIESYKFVVVHLYDPSSETSARIDLLLEKLAPEYLSTLFRRVPKANVPGSILEPLCINSGGASSALGCFRDGSNVAWSSHMASFCPTEDIEGGDMQALHTYLDHAHVLSTDVDEAISRAAAERVQAVSEEREEELFCDIPGCNKRFAHQHVGSGKPGQRGLLYDPNEQGIEALAAPTQRF